MAIALPAFVLAIVLGGCYLALFVLIPTSITTPIFRLLHSVAIIIEVAMVIYNYVKCIVTDPGTQWTYRHEADEAGLDISDISFGAIKSELMGNDVSLVDIEVDGHSSAPTSNTRKRPAPTSPRQPPKVKRRHCQKCSTDKPPRAHHCRNINKCVLRMDHFCIWVDNTIGQANQKLFILFLFYATLGICHYIALSVCGMLQFAATPNVWGPVVFVGLVMYAVCVLPVGVLVAGFTVWSLYLLLTNVTSIEYHEIGMLQYLVKRRFRDRFGSRTSITLSDGSVLDADSVTLKNIYDVGYARNAASILGPNRWLWLLPTAPNSHASPAYDINDAHVTFNRDVLHCIRTGTTDCRVGVDSGANEDAAVAVIGDDGKSERSRLLSEQSA